MTTRRTFLGSFLGLLGLRSVDRKQSVDYKPFEAYWQASREAWQHFDQPARYIVRFEASRSEVTAFILGGRYILIVRECMAEYVYRAPLWHTEKTWSRWRQFLGRDGEFFLAGQYLDELARGEDCQVGAFTVIRGVER